MGFGLRLDNLKTLTLDLEFLKDGSTCLFVLGSSTFFAVLCGIGLCLIFVNVDSIRANPIHQILYMIFSTYFVASIAFLDYRYDFNSEEISVMVFGVFCSYYTRYNLTHGGAKMLK